MFYDDAAVASKILDLVLTSRGKGTANQVPMCGIPYHSADNYIAKLIKAGQKVAICEQVEDPAAAKGIVKRDVIRTITSGTFLDDHSSDARYILCLSPGPKETGLAFIDPAAGTIQTNVYHSLSRCAEILARLPVCECVYPLKDEEAVNKLRNHPLLRTRTITFSPHEDWCFSRDIAHKALCEHFNLPNLRGFGIEDLDTAVSSAGALLEYLKQMNRQPLRHIDRVRLYSDNSYAYISPAAVYGLELNTLFRTINLTRSPLGKRKLHYWLFHPLKDPGKIQQRQDAVTLLKNQPACRDRLKDLLGSMPDAEKNISKLSCGYVHARDILSVRNALCLLPSLRETLADAAKTHVLFQVPDLPDLRTSLERAVNPDMPLSKYEGKVIRRGYHDELDQLRDIQENGRQWLKSFQEREAQRTGIHSLKVGFNKVFGYYIEVTRANLASVPDDYIRKQTLVNAERFITQELKDYEDRILTAQDKILKIEDDLIRDLQNQILSFSADLHKVCNAVARVDALYSLAALALRPGYTAPQLNTDMAIDIREGRHPVVEAALDHAFVPNDTYLDHSSDHLLILTGPNMAGKSTYIRQIALLIILAQMGSYIPAASAVIGTVDKIFTRIGAHDDITKGQSTFMVEMNEMADILNNLSERSLVILDEIGRGTSTYDGLSLAWAIAEYLQRTKTRALFATHFHELTALADDFPGVKNYNVAVKEWEDEVIFLHKIIPGSTDDSYGIYVAKLAGVPHDVIGRARTILGRLELKQDMKTTLASSQELTEQQIEFFQSAADPVLEELRREIRELDLNSMTPIEALAALDKLKRTANQRPKT